MLIQCTFTSRNMASDFLCYPAGQNSTKYLFETDIIITDLMTWSHIHIRTDNKNMLSSVRVSSGYSLNPKFGNTHAAFDPPPGESRCSLFSPPSPSVPESFCSVSEVSP